ncbi:MAG TPA: excisionase family DNA-binding protein [Gemmataceae bacterium]|nr:excisionase family DNA-binding protein [Gemmataceae bacterium]
MTDARMPDDPVSPKEAAKLLKVSGTTIRSWIAAGKMPAVRIGGRFWMDRADVLAKVERVQPATGSPLLTTSECRERDARTDRILRQAGIRK